MNPTSSQLPLDRFASLNIMVVGDVMLDRYVEGHVERISPEAPIPVMKHGREWASPGGAAHVAACLTALGCRVFLGGVVGDDLEAVTLRHALVQCGVTELAFLMSPIATTTKTRYLAGQRQQLLRVDRESDPSSIGQSATALFERIRTAIPDCDAVVLADYDKGTLTPELIANVIAEARRLGKPVIVDPKKRDFGVYGGASVLTPNGHEVERALGRTLRTDAEYEDAAASLRNTCELDAMLITRGPLGMTGFDANGGFRVPARVREVADVTGAGDTVVAVLAAAVAAGASVRDGCAWASVAAGIAVSHPGTYLVTAGQLRAALAGHSGKIVDWAAARTTLERERARGRRIVFTNGCFDVLHAGHLHSLNEARSLGDVLVVGLNGDDSVRSLKGPSRPIVPQDQRALLLAGLECVDLVATFDEATPDALIRHLAPDVLAKGADHDAATIVGADFVIARGGTVHVLSRIEGLSTTAIVAKVQGG